MLPSRPVTGGPTCANHDPEMWFDVDRRHEALDHCKGCPLRAECLVEALHLDHREREHGVWGGMVPRQRVLFKRRYGIVTVSHARELLDAIA